jgi:hypothetical protein
VALEEDFLFLGADGSPARGAGGSDGGTEADGANGRPSSPDDAFETPFDGLGAGAPSDDGEEERTHLADDAGYEESGAAREVPHFGDGDADADAQSDEHAAADAGEDVGSAPRPRSKLAVAVASIRTREDDLVARVLDAEQLLRQLEARGVAADAGYPSAHDFEERMLALTPRLAAMRAGVAAAARTRAGKAPSTKRKVRSDERSRRIDALAAIAEGLDRLRALDRDVGRAASSVGDTFRSIESKRLFEECGYASFDEFVERAIGESAVLSAARALAASEPRAAEPEPRAAAASLAALRAARSAASEEPAQAVTDEGHVLAVPPSMAPAAPPPAPVPSRAGGPSRLIASVALCIAATFGGAVAGGWGMRGAAGPETAAEGKDMDATVVAVAAPAASSAHAAVLPPHASSSSAPPPAPHAHPAGPREAKR